MGLGHSEPTEINALSPSALILCVLTGSQDLCKLFSEHHPAIMTRLGLTIMFACP